MSETRQVHLGVGGSAPKDPTLLEWPILDVDTLRPVASLFIHHEGMVTRGGVPPRLVARLEVSGDLAGFELGELGETRDRQSKKQEYAMRIVEAINEWLKSH